MESRTKASKVIFNQNIATYIAKLMVRQKENIILFKAH